MCIIIDKETIVAGYLSEKLNKGNFTLIEFVLQDIIDYADTLWNVGCGPVIPGFRKYELKDYVDNGIPFIVTHDDLKETYIADLSAVTQDRQVKVNACLSRNAVRRVLFEKLNACSSHPYELLASMGFGGMQVNG